MTFDEAFEALIGHEGGYSNDARDPGGETKFGVSKRAYPSVDVAALTLADAKAIYRRDYWGPAGCDAVPVAVKFDLFDMAVNAGVKAAIRTLQTTVFADVDGVLGPHTLMAAQSMDPLRLHARFNGLRLKAYTELATWPTFGRGWARRIAVNLIES